MINKDGLLALHDYDAYASQLVLGIASQLSVKEFEQRISPSHGSVRDLLVHTLKVQATYLGFCQQQSVERPPLDTFLEIQNYRHFLVDELRTFIIACSDTDLDHMRDITLANYPFRFPIWQLLIQSLIHNIHHRGELSIILTELGYPLPTLDIIIPFAEQSGQLWPWK